MRELNKSERKVITLLEQDCRMPASQIAKKTRLSPEGVLKIIQRLEYSRVITKFNTKINYSRIGYKIYPVHIKLVKLNQEIANNIKNVIKQHKSCAWFTFCEGEYELLLSFKILDEKEKSDMDKLLAEISEYILEKDISVVLNAFELSKSFLEKEELNKASNKFPNNLFATFDYSMEKIVLSKEEIETINLIKLKSRETILELASKLNSTARVIASRIKKLQQKKVITGFKTKLNMTLLGFQPCIALIMLGRYNEKDYKRLATYCQYAKGVSYFVRQIGKYEIELTFDVPDINRFYKLIDELRGQFPFIKKITTLISRQSN